MKITVPSQSDPGVTYDVDLDAPSCTCSHFARIAPRECKHFSQARRLAADQQASSARFSSAMYEQQIALDAVAAIEHATPAPMEELPGIAPAPTLAEADEAFLRELMNPDPDPERLPVPQSLALSAQIQAERLVRAILTAERPGNPDGVQALKARARADAQAWSELITAAEAKVDRFRSMVLDWMQRSGVTQLKCPWFTVSISKGRKTKVILDEVKALEICRTVYPKAIETVERLVKGELSVAVDTFPKHFEGVVEEQIGEPGLRILKK